MLALEKKGYISWRLFDKQLTWTPHINYVVYKCKNPLEFNEMRFCNDLRSEQTNSTYYV